MFSYAAPIVNAAEAVALQREKVEKILEELRKIPMDDFGSLLLSMPNQDYPGLSAMLPRMATVQVQQSWTGADGYTLLRQTLTFVRLLAHNFESLTGRRFEQCRVLDFGCGWGRIMRMMYYWSDPGRIHGCDPWDRAIDICRSDNVLGKLEQSDYLPQRLPFSDRDFDLVYAFSVFTHLSARAADVALTTLAKAVSPNGMLVITIRPEEYWTIHNGLSARELATLQSMHQRAGFAFRPHNRTPVDGDITYGDTSMSFDYVEKRLPGLKLRRVERTLDDPYQLILFFTR